MKKTLLTTLALTASLGLTGLAIAADTPDYTKMSPKELAEYLLLQSKSFKLDSPVQEGGTAKSRMEQDELQKICSEHKNLPPPELAGKIMTQARDSIKYPKDGVKLGDWKKGRELAWSGFGYRIGAKPDKHEGNTVGANCYNCHQLATDRTGGTLGTVLTGYGKIRGDDERTRRFVYDMIYNAHTLFPCTKMPRMGAKGLLSEQQIADIMAYLLDPESPVNH